MNTKSFIALTFLALASSVNALPAPPGFFPVHNVSPLPGRPPFSIPKLPGKQIMVPFRDPNLQNKTVSIPAVLSSL
ncbi:hypothetical protein BGY98DRAFT_999931 [Russula aff. rugulosa BPL654]|nr:hypothetical protein BGY98DRAFT_999931 [Russula aff. rugulosa BPL654]